MLHIPKKIGYLTYLIHFLNIFALIMHLKDNQKTKSDSLTLHDPLDLLLFIHSVVSNSLWPRVTPWTGAQQAFLSFTISQSLLKSCPLIQWCHLTISSSVALFSSCSQSFPVSWFFASSGQSTGASASASFLQVNLQDWFPLGLTGLISFQSKGLSRVFSNITVQKHRFFGAQPSLWSNSHIHTWWLEKP